MKKEFILLAALFAAQFSFAQKQDTIKSIHIQEVQVISNRATEKTPFSYSNMGKEEIEKYNFGQDIPFLIALTPSVVTTSEAGTGIGYTGFRIRGTDANRINITTNGIPLNDAESQTVFWVNIPDLASSLQDLQVQRGVGTSTNGAGAFGASVNMKTENIPAKAYGELNGTYGSFNTSKATLKLGTGIIGNHFAFDARLSDIQSDGYIDRASADLKSYFFQGAYYDEKNILKFIVFGGKEKTYHAWDGVPKDKLETDRTFNPSGHMEEDDYGNPLPPFYDDQTDNYTQKNYQALFTRIFKPELQLNAALHYTKGDGFYNEYKIGRKLIEYGLVPFESGGKTIKKSDLVRQKWLDNDFYGGIFSLNYKKDKWDAVIGGGANYYDGNHFGKVMWLQNYLGGSEFYPEHEYYRNTAGKTDANIYAKANYSLTSKLNIYGDLQYRYIHYKMDGTNDKWDSNTGAMQILDFDETFNFFNPKAGLFYKINEQNNMYASFAIANREPNRKNYTNGEKDKMPVSEKLFDYELGYTFKHHLFSAGMNLYYMKYDNQLILNGKVNEIGEMLTSNIPDSYRAGAEFTLGANICSWLKWNGNLTISRNRIKNFTEYVTVYDENWERKNQQYEQYLGTVPIAFSPEIIAGSLFSFSYKNWDGGLLSNYVGKQYIDNTGDEQHTLDAYFVTNLQMGYSFNVKGLKKLKLSVLVNNIFNQKYETNAWIEPYYQQPDPNSPNMDKYEPNGYFPQAGTNVMANLSVTF